MAFVWQLGCELVSIFRRESCPSWNKIVGYKLKLVG